MAQLVRMDAHLDTLNNELCQVNTRVDRIARRQAIMGGFTASLYESSHVLKGRVSIRDIFVRRSVFFLRDVIRTFCSFSFLSILDTLFLHCDSKPCTHYIYIYIY